ncbi:MAG: hypothetical protein GVY22_16005 [Gammaproteobacteria bacterium]|nr:hypothetical protein [Gammaproteobacteria bacterium]
MLTKRDLAERYHGIKEGIAYEMLWSGKGYTPDQACEAREMKERYAAVA